ncbi:MAG TPA: YciI-like protein [Acidimicrobiales bacterium]|nr:YciI-like protein [Acidimicrobiales bacterium]
MHWLLLYDVVDDYVERRVPHRAAHLALATEAFERGDLVMAGALADPADGVVLVFRGDTPSSAEEFARRDPYVEHGVVTRWRVREWTVVVGPGIDPPQM